MDKFEVQKYEIRNDIRECKYTISKLFNFCRLYLFFGFRYSNFEFLKPWLTSVSDYTIRDCKEN
jgi:hypothetical protein